MLEKWVRKLKLDMSSTISTGMRPVIKFIINGNPLMVNKKETKIDKIKAIIWLFVRDEKKIPSET